MLLRRQESSRAAALEFERDGVRHFHCTVLPSVERLRSEYRDVPTDRAGARLASLAGVQDLVVAEGPIGAIAATFLGLNARPVRALFFDKSAAANWGLGWHQDRVICVKERRDAVGFENWTVKAGNNHVSPPFGVLAAMVTLRVHLDDVDPDNAPLLIAPGSHRFGRIAEADIDSTITKCGTHACLAIAGDVWCYATPILHASKPASAPTRRRVLQIDYAAHELPDGLEWSELI